YSAASYYRRSGSTQLLRELPVQSLAHSVHRGPGQSGYGYAAALVQSHLLHAKIARDPPPGGGSPGPQCSPPDSTGHDGGLVDHICSHVLPKSPQLRKTAAVS